jgi:hypothetical protein
VTASCNVEGKGEWLCSSRNRVSVPHLVQLPSNISSIFLVPVEEEQSCDEFRTCCTWCGGMVSGRLEWLIAVGAGLQENRTKAVEQELELKRT